jgi:hypothetical protein
LKKKNLTNKATAWATVDNLGAITALCYTREEARQEKRWAEFCGGGNRNIVKLSFEKVVR